MENLNLIFERKLLKETLETVKSELTKRGIDFKKFKKHSWAYKFGLGDVEFQINKNENLSEGFYWHGSGDSLTYAKAEGWTSFLENLNNGRLNLKAGI